MENEMNTVKRAIAIIDELPVALQQYVAKFILDTLPSIPGDDAGTRAIQVLSKNTGLNTITCKVIVRGWLFDMHNVMNLKSRTHWTR